MLDVGGKRKCTEGGKEPFLFEHSWRLELEAKKHLIRVKSASKSRASMNIFPNLCHSRWTCVISLMPRVQKNNSKLRKIIYLPLHLCHFIQFRVKKSSNETTFTPKMQNVWFRVVNNHFVDFSSDTSKCGVSHSYPWIWVAWGRAINRNREIFWVRNDLEMRYSHWCRWIGVVHRRVHGTFRVIRSFQSLNQGDS